MKNFICVLILMIFTSPVYSQIITGEVEYNEENVRGFVFSSDFHGYNPDKISGNLIDKSHIENLNCLYSGITELKDRKLAIFSDGSYGIQYYDDNMYSWYYSPSGRLISFTYKERLEYPHKITKYKPDGKIANTGYQISETESYIYDSEGKLLGHWVGEICFDKDNNIVMTRKLY